MDLKAHPLTAFDLDLIYHFGKFLQSQAMEKKSFIAC